MVRALAVLLAVPLAVPLLLTGCATAAAPTSTPAAARGTRPAVTEAARRTAASPAEATCTDRKGDGDGFDIRSVDVARVGDAERVQVHVRKMPDFAAHETAAVIVSFFDPSGNHGGMFTTRWLPSGTSMSVFDLDATHNASVQDVPLVTGKTITMLYPAELLDRAGEGWLWNAVTTLDGSDIDSCRNASWKRARFS